MRRQCARVRWARRASFPSNFPGYKCGFIRVRQLQLRLQLQRTDGRTEQECRQDSTRWPGQVVRRVSRFARADWPTSIALLILSARGAALGKFFAAARSRNQAFLSGFFLVVQTAVSDGVLWFLILWSWWLLSRYRSGRFAFAYIIGNLGFGFRIWKLLKLDLKCCILCYVFY